MATPDEIRTIIHDAESVLRQRRKDTTDPAEKVALTRGIDDLGLLLDRLDLAALSQHAAVLNDLASTMEASVAALRSRPFDQIFGQLQKIFDRIGSAQGTQGRQLRLPRTGVAIPAQPLEPTDGKPASAKRSAAIKRAPGGPDATRLAAMFETCKLRPDKLAEIDGDYLEPLLRGRKSYEAVGAALSIPWWFVGVVHGLEATFSFETHLHNGDPLTARTTSEPAGRPREGTPPFGWADSARDALTGESLAGLDDWSLGTALDRLERYNGLGYRNRGVASPYLWCFSSHYVKGKFVADKVFDPEFESRQCGAAVMLRRLVDRNIVALDEATGDVSGEAALALDSLAVSEPLAAVPAFAAASAAAELEFPGTIGVGSAPPGLGARRVQEWCSLGGAPTSLDGSFLEGTAAAVRAFQAKRGVPATGIVDERTWIELTLPMRRALAPIEVAPGAKLGEVVVRVARQHLAEHPMELTINGETNSGPWVRLYMNGHEGEKQLWCAGFVSFVIGQAAKAMGIEMPIERQVGVDALVADAKKAGRFLREADVATGLARREKLQPGMLFVRRKSPTDWTHTGILAEIGDAAYSSIEGNANDAGSDNGVEVCERSRGYADKDFIALV